MANTTTAYSVLHPMFEKVSKTIQSCTTPEQFSASIVMAEGFLSYIEDQPYIGEMPEGYCRTILATYYGSAITQILINHPLFK